MTTISVQADTPNAIAFAKGMLNPLLLGAGLTCEDNTPLWHASFSRSEATAAFEQLNAQLAGSALVFCDLRRREIRLWGGAAACERARKAVHAMHAEIMNSQQHVLVKPGEFKALLRQGHGVLGEIESACGARSVSLDIKTRSVQLVGDDAVASRVGSFIARKLADTDTAGERKAGSKGEDVAEKCCPVCYCEPDDDALVLSCEHDYCTACFREWIKSAAAAGGGSS